MGMTYYRRFRMEFDFGRQHLPEPLLPAGYDWTPWRDASIERHACVKYDSFRDEVDAVVFRCLGHYEGCQRLMSEISEQNSFLPDSTWLITRRGDEGCEPADCGTIQGLKQRRRVGSVQNVGVVPTHRGLGLGRALVVKSLHGFRKAGLRHVSLEVTADNAPAIELYKSIGFRLTRTMYKDVDVQPAACY
jgi:hypothetical protein